MSKVSAVYGSKYMAASDLGAVGPRRPAIIRSVREEPIGMDREMKLVVTLGNSAGQKCWKPVVLNKGTRRAWRQPLATTRRPRLARRSKSGASLRRSRGRASLASDWDPRPSRPSCRNPRRGGLRQRAMAGKSRQLRLLEMPVRTWMMKFRSDRVGRLPANHGGRLWQTTPAERRRTVKRYKFTITATCTATAEEICERYGEVLEPRRTRMWTQSRSSPSNSRELLSVGASRGPLGL